MAELYGFCLSIAYIAVRRHPYIESLPTLMLNEGTCTRVVVVPRRQRLCPAVLSCMKIVSTCQTAVAKDVV